MGEVSPHLSSFSSVKPSATIAVLLHHKASNGRNPSWLQAYVITAQLCHSAWKSDPTCAAAWLIARLHAVCNCAQTWFPRLLLCPFFCVCLLLVFALMHSAHSRFMHTQPQLFVYAGIFSNRAREGYTFGGKHGVPRWSVGVLSLLFVYRSFPCLSSGQRDKWWMETIWGRECFSFNRNTARVPTQKYQNIVTEPVFI